MVRNRERGWELPGGRIEAGETAAETARREFAEETGHRLLRPRELELPQTIPWDHLVIGFLGRSGNRRNEDVVQEWRFVADLDDAAPLSFPRDPYEELAPLLGRPLRARRARTPARRGVAGR